VQVIECAPKGIEREDLWVLWVPGRKNTLWEGGLYPVTIAFPPAYPRVAPSIVFDPEFKHVHVYEGGAICLPLLESEHWRSKTNMSDILQRIVSLIHQEVNPYSPANVELLRLLK
jgi:ubiquitin-protein ligase